MSWFILFIAGTLEAGWLVGLQKSESFTKPYYIIFAIFSMALSLVLFSVTLKEILITTAYIVWLAVGASSISIINHYFFEQPITIQQLFCFCLIFIGVLCLKISN
ncbi:QacE family quaternary ammonium compound efflux SMR transporter [Colwellia sp. MB02u-6]|uniref:DMT family transporter n=1 Tax=Colwellia sp. MB02u-6 TaxID=2759824 RepID=UPI0015F7201B|nr:SMR family transporter [Colwellia sp. MB02u-6]MBA6327840.1 QacE family quaternary ammonium compound efflux SMR transporter [Colwellia sp. MB02u-6]